MTVPAVPGAPRSPGLAWDFMQLRIRQRVLSLAAFALLYSALVILGLALRENSKQLTIIWPAAGLLFMALWFSPRRNWIWILGVQIAVEMLIDVARSEHFSWARYGPFVLANSLDAIVGALVARRLMATPEIPKVRHVLQFLAAVALGAAASASVGAVGWSQSYGLAEYLREWQLWWAGNWLGSLCIAPVVMSWAVRWRVRQLSAPPGPAIESALIFCVVLGMTVRVFSAPPGSVTTIIDMPFILLAFMLVAAFRMPPRWCTTLATAAALLASYFASRGVGPFAGDPNPFVRVAAVQLYLATLVAISFILTVVLLEMRNALQLLRTSAERYHNFVEQSSEAVWRVELDVPMPADLAPPEQIAWLREHASVAECNLVYLRLSRLLGLPDADAHRWRADVPWSAIYLDHLGKAANQGHSVDGLQFTLSDGAKQFTYITGIRGVIESGKLVRLWCVARDITELVELNDSFAREAGSAAAVCAAVGRRGGARPARDRRGSARRDRSAAGGPGDDPGGGGRARLAGGAAGARRGDPHGARGAGDHSTGHRRLESAGPVRSRIGTRPQVAQRLYAPQGQSAGRAARCRGCGRL